MKKIDERWLAALLAVLLPVAIAVAINVTETKQMRQLSSDPNLIDNADRGILGTYMPAYQIDEATPGTTYIRYSSSTGVVHILRVVEAASVTTITRTTDEWDDRATATYVPVIL